MQGMKKVIFSLLDTPAFGGAEQYMFSQLRFLNKKGFDIVLATNNETVKKEFLSRLPKNSSFKIMKAPYRLDAIGNWKGLVKYFISLPYSLFWCYQTIRNLKKKYQEVYCLWPGFSDRLSFSPIAKGLRAKLIWIEIGPLEPTFRKNFGFPKLLYSSVLLHPDLVVTTSEFTKKSVIRNTKIQKEKIKLVYPGTPLPVVKTDRKTKELIGVVARLSEENEIDMVLRAFSKFSKKDQFNLLIIGEGPEKKELQNLSRDLKVSKNVNFTGFISEEEKRKLLLGCRFFIFPRAWDLDGFGMTTIEAMSLGLPVLTTDFGPQKEILTDGKEGFKYKPHDPDDLALKMEKMANLSEDDLKTMKENALKRAQDFSEEKSNHNMLSAIQKI
jgi:glycosyltransferase involved in cell wall biosynthesis